MPLRWQKRQNPRDIETAPQPMSARRGVVRVCLMGLVAAAIWALPTTPAVSETLREALARAYSYNPQLDAERARLRATDEDVARAQSGFRPTISGTAQIGHRDLSTSPRTQASGGTNPVAYGVSVTQPIFSGWQTTNAVNEAESNVRAGRENLRRVEANTLLDAAQAYLDIVRDQTILARRLGLVRVLSRELQAAEARRAAREVTLTDVAQARARRARALSSADLARANLEIAKANYKRVIGAEPGRVFKPPMTLKYLPRSRSAALAIAERESPNVISALYREQAARFAVSRTHGELLPELNVEASYAHRSGSSNLISQEDDSSITGRLTIPFYRGGEVHARVRQAKHTHVSRLQEIEQARTETIANVSSAWSRLVAARAQLRSDQVQVTAAETALDGVREEERVGQRDLLDVLNAEEEALSARIQLARTRRDLVLAGYTLLAQMGRLSASDIELTDMIYNDEAHYAETKNKWFGISITQGDRRDVRPFDPDSGHAQSEADDAPPLDGNRMERERVSDHQIFCDTTACE